MAYEVDKAAADCVPTAKGVEIDVNVATVSVLGETFDVCVATSKGVGIAVNVAIGSAV